MSDITWFGHSAFKISAPDAQVIIDPFFAPSAGVSSSAAGDVDIVLVTHELPSIYAVADTCLFLDNQTRTQIALGPLAELLEHGPETVQRFLRRGEAAKHEVGK